MSNGKATYQSNSDMYNTDPNNPVVRERFITYNVRQSDGKVYICENGNVTIADLTSDTPKTPNGVTVTTSGVYVEMNFVINAFKSTYPMNVQEFVDFIP